MLMSINYGICIASFPGHADPNSMRKVNELSCSL